jgi:competence protein CoiA
MKFALVNEQRREAQPDLSGKCLTCGHPMVAKCGEVRIWHWAHRGSRLCDPWWENETEWHRAWKDQFPISWQEVVQRAEDGEKHVADVKTDHGCVIEFQNSYINPEERRSRETFYTQLVWVVNGSRRKTDKQKFSDAWLRGVAVGPSSQLRKIVSHECVLLREWVGVRAPVFFDFGEPMLVWFLHVSFDGSMYVTLLPRADFIKIHRGGATDIAFTFDDLVKDLRKRVAVYDSHVQTLQRVRTQPLPSFEQYHARQRRFRRRF